MTPACWLCGGEGSSKEQWPLPVLLSGRKLSSQLLPSSQIIHFPTICLWYLSSTGAQREGVQSKSVHRPSKKNCLGFQIISTSFSPNPAGFYSQKLWGLLGTGILGWGADGGLGTTPLR